MPQEVGASNFPPAGGTTHSQDDKMFSDMRAFTQTSMDVKTVAIYFTQAKRRKSCERNCGPLS
jgi:hypothetical protein